VNGGGRWDGTRRGAASDDGGAGGRPDWLHAHSGISQKDDDDEGAGDDDDDDLRSAPHPQAYYILDELFIGGQLQESSKNEVRRLSSIIPLHGVTWCGIQMPVASIADDLALDDVVRLICISGGGRLSYAAVGGH
jgi:hypothetical protein